MPVVSRLKQSVTPVAPPATNMRSRSEIEAPSSEHGLDTRLEQRDSNLDFGEKITFRIAEPAVVDDPRGGSGKDRRAPVACS